MVSDHSWFVSVVKGAELVSPKALGGSEMIYLKGSELFAEPHLARESVLPNIHVFKQLLRMGHDEVG